MSRSVRLTCRVTEKGYKVKVSQCAKSVKMDKKVKVSQVNVPSHNT